MGTKRTITDLEYKKFDEQGNVKTTQLDSSGNPIDSHLSADGGAHLGVSVIQSIHKSLETLSTDNLAYNETYTGGAEATYGISGIQVYHSSDKDTIVYVDQSIDETFVDTIKTITDETICYANKACTRVIMSVAPFYRVRVKNVDLSEITTTNLVIDSAMTPIINPLPRALSHQGNLQVVTSIRDDENYDRHVWVNPTSEMAVSPVYRMVGTNFDGTTKDPNFWTDGSLLDGSVTQGGGEIELYTNEDGATAASSAKYTSVRKSRFVAGSAQYFSGGFNFKTASTANNIRRVGAYTTTDTINTPVDGFYFELNNGTFSVNSRANAGTVNSITSGNFNGNINPHFTPLVDTYYKLTIELTPLAVLFYIGESLLHKMKGAHLSNFMTLPITMENLNTAGSTNVNFESVGMYIARQGELITAPATKRASGVSGTVFKYGAGNLRGMQISNVTDNADINIYDGTSTAGVLIWASGNLKKKEDGRTTSVDFFGAPFNDGLFVSIVDENADVLIVYE